MTSLAYIWRYAGVFGEGCNDMQLFSLKKKKKKKSQRRALVSVCVCVCVCVCVG